MNATLKRPLDQIHTVAHKRPELALLAAVVRVAIEDAAAGDLHAWLWLASSAVLPWLAWIIPHEIDTTPEKLQQHILTQLPKPRGWQAAMQLEDDECHTSR